MSHVFIAGSTGYMGKRLIPALLEEGHRVRALVRRGSENKLAPGCEAVSGNPLEESSFFSSISPCDTWVHLVGVSHPSPSKAQEFREIDQKSVEVAAPAAKRAGIKHFVYVSVAHPAPAMKAYVAVRQHCEGLIRDSGLNATFLRPWYVLGEGHRWPLVLKPVYWMMEQIPATRERALRLGLVTIEQMTAALVTAIETPATGIRIVSVPQIRKSLR